MTAVEWLEEQYQKQITFLHREDFEQAKEMEKEGLKDAYEQGARLALISQSNLALHKGKFPTPDEWIKNK